MTETVPTPEAAAAARAAEQVRLRKERREAKIKAGGAARLNKITGLGGGFQRDPAPAEAPAPSPPRPSSRTSTAPPPQSTTPSSSQNPSSNSQTNHDDPDEVDISQHYYAPQQTQRVPEPSLSEAQLRQMMLGFEAPGGSGPATPPRGNPFFDPSGAGIPPGMDGLADDPMMKIMQQMMGGAGGPFGGGAGGGNPFAGTGMEGLFGPAAAGGPEGLQAQQAAAVTDKSANVWRILHAVFALGLGLYIALSTTFTGTKTERDFGALSASGSTTTVTKDDFGDFVVDGNSAKSIDQARAYFFYLFTSIEAVLLTTRYFLDKKRAPPSGILWTISGFLPGQLGTGVKHALRYVEIFSTVRSDALVCVFVLGVCCWLRA
ncbi:hypothetical protein TruAng_002585 [Truncatella angustata]|nr:hypothetical protein TruAng_002585 [Truncatella angustata]